MMEEARLKKLKQKAQKDRNTALLLSSCTDLADLYVKQDQFELAIQEYTIIADEYKSQDKHIEFAKANRAIGEAYIGLHNFAKALEHQRIYLTVADSMKDRLEMQRAYATIGHTYLTWYLETQTDPQTKLQAAYKNLMRSLELAETLKNISKLEKVDMMARLFSNLGLVKESQGEYDLAVNLINRSIDLCTKHDIYEQLSRGYLSIASIYEKRNEHKDAICYYNHAIEAAKKLKGNCDLMSATLLAKSDALIKLSEFHNAKQVLLKAYKLKTPNVQDKRMIERNLKIVASMCYTEDKLLMMSNDNKEMKNLYEKMGDGACDLKNFTKAIEYYKLMLQYAEKSGASDREIAACYYSLAETYKDIDNNTEAVKFFEKEYELCVQLKDKLNTLSMIADTKEEANSSLKEVRAVYEKAIEECRFVKNVKEEKRMTNRLIQYLRRQNQHVLASQQESLLNKLAQFETEEDSSSSESECCNNMDDSKHSIGHEINLDDITDNSDNSDLENFQNDVITTSPAVGKRRSRNFIIKKNAKGESQLHTACINGSLMVVNHLLEQGHPVNVRDNSGWLPLHEACNHGHLEVVEALLDKGAAINDRGGTHCGGVTPLYDASNNGHLEIVELLLDRGASVLSRTDDGDTPLNVLKMYHTNQNFIGERYVLYKKLVKRMSEVMEKAGCQLENRTTPSFVDRRKEHELIRDRSKSNISISEDCMDEDNLSSNEGSDSGKADEYHRIMNQLRKKSTDSSQSSRNSGKRSALIRDEDNLLDDWLDDDMGTTTNAKRRKTNLNSSLIVPSIKRRSSGSPKKSQSSIRRTNSALNLPDDDDEDFVVTNFDIRKSLSPSNKKSPRRSSNERISQNSTRRTSQVSLLDAGFSRNLTHQMKSSTSLSRTGSFSTPKPVQTKLTTFNSTTTDNLIEMQTTQQTITNEPLSGGVSADPMHYVDVKIEDTVFRVPVLWSQIQTNTIGWLAEQASIKYARKEFTKPSLELATTSGALLSDEDPLCLLFPRGEVQAEPVVARILKISLPPLVERYKDVCAHSSIDPDETLCRHLEEISISLDLRYKGYLSKTLVPLCKALNHQSTLLDLDLSGNFLDNDCIRKLCTSLPSLQNLTTLQLRCTGLLSSHLADMVQVFETNVNPMLDKLVHLDLSDNPLKDKCLPHLAKITKHLKLVSLRLSNVKFTKHIESEMENRSITTLDLNNLEVLDLSDNKLESRGIRTFLLWINVSKIRHLDVSRNCIADHAAITHLNEALEDCGNVVLERLNLSRCMVPDSELYSLLRLCSKKTLKYLNLSYNSDLTGISLRRLLEHPNLQEIILIGCDNIFKYFDDCNGCNLLQESNEETKRLIKLSTINLKDYECQVRILINLFTNKYPECYHEIDDNFLLLSSKCL